MKIVGWSILNNELTFLQDTVDYHLQFLDYLYFLDTGSTDGTYEYLLNKSRLDKRIIVEKYVQSFIPEYERDWEKSKNLFPEVEVRNYAIKRAETLFPDRLIQIDGDEIFLPIVRSIIEANPNFNVLGHVTINPVERLENHPIERRNGLALYDPHARIWRGNYGFAYMTNPAFKSKQYHCIPYFTDLYGHRRHLYHYPLTKFVPEIFHFHLHWMYGPKVDAYFKTNNDLTKRKQIVESQFTNQYSSLLPDLFWQRRRDWLEGK